MTNLTEAIQQYANETWHDGDLITDYVIITATIDSNGIHGLGVIPSRDPMPNYVLKGLLTDALDHTRDGEFEFYGDDDD